MTESLALCEGLHYHWLDVLEYEGPSSWGHLLTVCVAIPFA